MKQEYNLKAIRQDFKESGVFHTSLKLANKFKQYAPKNVRQVYDPTCGVGSLLSVFDDDVKKYGQELDPDQLKIAEKNLVNFTGACGDTLATPHFIEKKFDFIIANPPFSVKWEPKTDERFIDCPTLPTAGRADYAFLLHILHMLDDNGTAAVVNAPGVLYRGAREGKIRKWFVQNNFIDRIVSIPENSFVDTSIPTVLIVLKKKKNNTNIIFEDSEKNETKTVPLEEIEKNDFNLSLSLYIKEKQVQKVKEDPWHLEMESRKEFVSNLKKDLNLSKMVCVLEGYDFDQYLTMVEEVINSYRRK